MKKTLFLLVLISFVLASGTSFAQHNIVDPMNVWDDIQRGESPWREADEIRDARYFAETGVMTRRPRVVSRPWQSLYDEGVIYTESFRRTSYLGNGLGSYYGGGYYDHNGKWVALAVAGADAVTGIIVSNKAQNTIRRGMDQDYNVRMRELDMQQARELREFEARQEQTRWDRQQQTQLRQSREAAQPTPRSQSYQLQETRSYFLENKAPCGVDVSQNGELKISLQAGEYRPVFLNKEDGPIRLGGYCEGDLQYEFVGEGAILIFAR